MRQRRQGNGRYGMQKRIRVNKKVTRGSACARQEGVVCRIKVHGGNRRVSAPCARGQTTAWLPATPRAPSRVMNANGR